MSRIDRSRSDGARCSRREFSTLLSLVFGGALLSLAGPAGAAGAEGEEAQPDLQFSADHEDALLLCAFDYLQLSRSQLGLLHAYAHQTGQRLQAFDLQVQDAERALQRIPEDQTELLDRIRTDLKTRQTQLAAAVTAEAAQGLVRLLSREQIALMWRLTSGRPPKYAEADASLLAREAGFVSPESLWPGMLERGTAEIELLGAGGRTDLPEAATAEERLTRYLTLGAPSEPPELGIAITTDGSALLESNRLGRILTFSGRGASGEDRPFPQLVVETDNLADLVPAILPFVRRLFLSERLEGSLESALRNGLGYANGAARRSTSTPHPRVVRDYRMERGFADQSGHGPEVEALGGVIDHGVYQFEPGQGLRMADSGVLDQYAIEIQFEYFGGDNYQKLLDFQNRAVDDGLYFYQGHMTFYTLANGGKPVAGQEQRLRLERNRKTRIVRAFLDLQPIFSFLDLDDQAVLQDGQGLLFVDDAVTGNEQGPGAVRRVTVWDAPLR